jgi:predicted ATPase
VSSTFINRVVLRNYRSIAACDVPLGPLTFLVGLNGAGKSNFLDALRLVAESLRTSLDHALRDRSGIKEVRRRSSGHPNHFGIRLEMMLPSGVTGHYAFQVGARPNGAFEVTDEQCVLRDEIGAAPKHFFRVRLGKVEAEHTSLKVAPAAVPDRLYLVNASGLPEFRPVYDLLSRMGFYNLNPDRIRALQHPDAGEVLSRDGGNLASVLAQIGRRSPPTKERVEEYLSKVVPGVLGVDLKTVGPMETVEFRQRVEGAKDPWRFGATNMSDGTLRALGLLVAVFQSSGMDDGRVPLVGIEEPEAALHPAAAGVLRDCLRDASRRTQVLVTSHSPELLDDRGIQTSSILAVQSRDGITEIGPPDEAGRTMLQENLYTAGELLRLDQLTPAPLISKAVPDKQLGLFDGDVL